MDHLIDPEEVQIGEEVYIILGSLHHPVTLHVLAGKIAEIPEFPHKKAVRFQNGYCKIEAEHALFKTEEDAYSYYREIVQ